MEEEKSLEERVKAYDERACFRMRMGDYSNAIKEYEKILEIDPANAVALSNIGLIMHSYLRDSESAVNYLEKAVEASPDAGFAYFNLAMVHKESGNFEDAIKNYKKAIELDQNITSVEQGRTVEMTYVAYHNLGIIYFDMKKFDDAVRYFDNAISINPRHYQTYEIRGYAKLGIGDFKGAVKDFEKSIELGNKSKEVKNDLIMLKKGHI